MKTEIKLKAENSETIYVDEVRVEDGVYAGDNKSDGLYFIGTDKGGFVKRFLNGNESAYTWDTVLELLTDNNQRRKYNDTNTYTKRTNKHSNNQ